MAFVFDQLASEMAQAELGDARRSRRLGLIVEALVTGVGKSLPKALVSEAALEATYRLMSNEAVTPERILAPHVVATCERAEEAECILAIHDTTECEFTGDHARAGLGWLSPRRQGFFAQVCLATSLDGVPLGILDLHTWVRTHRVPGPKKRATYAYQTRAVKESDRWCEGAARVESRLRPRARVIHVMDREADFYRLETALVEASAEFVIRGSHLERRLADGSTLDDATHGIKARLSRDVPLSYRTGKNRNGKHPARSARAAELFAGATTVPIKRSWSIPSSVGLEFNLNVVHVWEPEPPDGEPAVAWTLLTTLPIETADQIAFVVDVYRQRWIIEELFKALKTGCQYEKLQLETAPALLNALAIMLPIAAGILALRHIAGSNPHAPADEVITPLQRKILLVHEHTRQLPLDTAADALGAVARLGGHIKNNGDPGWIVLARGYEELLTLERGARLQLQM
jgi:hypothetical protein